MQSKKEIQLKEGIKTLSEGIKENTRAWQKEPSSKVRNELFFEITNAQEHIKAFQEELRNIRKELDTTTSGSNSPSGIDELHSEQDDEEEDDEEGDEGDNTWRIVP